MKLYIKTINGKEAIKTRNQIVLRVTKEINGVEKQFQVINPTEEMILADGWVEYIPPQVGTPSQPAQKSRMQVIQELVAKQWNERTDISNEEALDYAVIVFPWADYIGKEKELVQGKIVSHDGKLWRVRQTHTAQADWMPSLESASLWEVIEVEHSGTLDDPIPYSVPMEIFNGKYYTETNQLYLCTRDSGIALSHPLSALVGVYVDKI